MLINSENKITDCNHCLSNGSKKCHQKSASEKVHFSLFASLSIFIFPFKIGHKSLFSNAHTANTNKNVGCRRV